MESLNQGVMKVLNITKGDMIQMFDSIYSDTEKEPWKWVEDFLSPSPEMNMDWPVK